MGTALEITDSLKQIEEEYRKRMQEALAPARNRLDEIQQQRDALDREEDEIRRLLEMPTRERKPRRRSTGKRMTAAHKKEIMGRFIEQGWVKDQTVLSKELRTALSDEGIGTNDFRKLNDYLPAGWEARSNGLRGTAAKTVFHKV